VTRILSFFLKPGGCLMVSDIMKSSDGAGIFTHSTHADIVAHKGGFDDTDIRKAFDAADLHDITFDKVTSAMKDGHSVDFFLAKGVKSL
jgi:hypothetical protein